ncbi:tripartite motif-containing protein 46 isoform X1 [Megalops cyprinoides]|uniref:tripartite motif-containing protein 46 isoform X1 n=2 Tax=Megalops cyprinoides TaxID=118141 RepID=UPI0018647C14|nr:tripartite motif-containing protein 46 isoform X1 [Megalops cyprinoides]
MAEADLQTFTSIMDALVRISSNMKSMERELQCPVCKEMVKQPIILPCQHSVCLLCASEVLVQNGYPAPDLPPEPKSPASTPNTRSPRQARRPAPKVDRIDRVLRPGYGTYPGRRRKEGPPPAMLFPCPPCGREVELGEKGLADCLRNLTLERIVERYRHTVSLGTVAVMCQFCKPPQSLEATKGCADCRSNFCNECFKLYHPWGTPRAQHEHVQPTLNFRPKVLTCPEHDQERLHFYCKSCQRLLCPLCKLRRVHAGHKVTPIAQACQALKEKITKGINYILANQETVQAQITQLENAITQTEMNSASAKEQLTQCVRELGAALAERQGVLTQALEAARHRRGEALSAQVTERQSLLEHAGLLAFSQELLKETDPPCFVQAARLTHNRLVKAIENLQCFSLSADPSFRHFQMDISRELKLLTSLDFIQAPLAPVIDTQRTLAYDQLFLCWRLPQDSAPAWHFSVEFRRREGRPGSVWGGVRGSGGVAGSGGGHWGWQRLEEVGGTSTVIERLEMDSVYVLRVRGCNKAGFGEYSEEVYLHTPPAPVLNFYLDSRWGLHSDRLVVSKEQRCARSVPGLSLLQAADRALTSCHLTSDLLVGDVAITQGRHYWACSVEPGSYLVKVGVGLETKLQEWFHLPQDMASPRYDPDSGHDSGAEDAMDSPPPFSFLTIGMGKVLLPQGTHSHNNCPSNATSPREPTSNPNNNNSHPTPPPAVTAPLPPRLGVCLDFEKGRVTFYDAHSLRPLWEGPVDCSAPVCPAFCFIGGGALQLQDLVANRTTEQPPSRRVTIQSRVTNLNN